MIKFDVAECIETKTVTTTTTTKRSYPPLRVRETRALASLNVKEYPLARKPTPPELAHVTFGIDDPLPSTAIIDDSDYQNVGWPSPAPVSLVVMQIHLPLPFWFGY